MNFPAARVLCTNVDDEDRYIVSLGWVTSGGERVLGVLYGAGSRGSLDANRIFARWLQKKLVFTVADDKPFEVQIKALGPDRQLVFCDKPVNARVELLGDDGKTPIARTEGAVELQPGRAYQVTVDRSRKASGG